MSLVLVIGNKAYSSWSLRPWLLMSELGLDFDEILIPLDRADTRERITRHSPSGKVPCLLIEDLSVWDTLAIMETLAERFPEAGVWPADADARAVARSVSAEMHSGFTALRSACPMNLRKRFAFRDWGGSDGAADVARIQAIWADCRSRFGAGGPFLFGTFSAADAMYAPVVARLDRYCWEVTPETRAYMNAVLALPSFQRWTAQGVEEPWILAHDEVDAPAL
ncbi:glutathione S-transferase family protein [Amorphus coralli]|uniref:glutathione S-transferase family protein n=1 Tax=Amorphus coralli TaxID=340680 RepID=UPI0003726DDC|nr:glutathione S-transferase family protein [Amorphus coralli]